MEYYKRSTPVNNTCVVYKSNKLDIIHNLNITVRIGLLKKCAKLVVHSNRYVTNTPTSHMPLDISTVHLQFIIHPTHDFANFIKREIKRIDQALGKSQRIYLINRLKRVKRKWKYRSFRTNSSFSYYPYSLYHNTINYYTPPSLGFKKNRF